MSRSKAIARVSGLALLVMLAAACASTGASGGGGNPDLITREQIEDLSEENAYLVVRRLRSGWLRPRSQASLGAAARRDPLVGAGTQAPAAPLPVVFVDDIRYGEVETLTQIALNEIESMQFIGGIEATTRYGTGYDAGIIHVRTRSR
jgi:hypothetical protein